MANLPTTAPSPGGWNLNPVSPDGTPTTANMGVWRSYAPTEAPYARDPSSEGYYGAPTGFVQQVKNAFAINHADVDDGTAQYFADQLWQVDPRVQAYYSLNPADTANAGMIGGYLFSPKSTTPSLAYQAINQIDPGNLTSSQADFVNAGGNPSATSSAILNEVGANATNGNQIMSIIVDEAQKAGHAAGLSDSQIQTLSALAIATADAESGLNPSAVGDGGHSVGLFQLHDQGEGAGMGNARYDPRTNAAKALSVMAATFAANPGLSPGQIAAAAQRPADQVGYANTVNGIFQQIMGGRLPSLSSPGKLQGPEYAQAADIYAQYFGKTADPSVIDGIIGAGNDKQQMEDYVRALPSHLPGMTIGQYSDIRKEADSAMTALAGHQATDGIVAEIFNGGNTTPLGIKHFIGSLPFTLDPKLYNTIYSASAPIVKNVWNETGYDPRWAQQIAASQNVGPPTNQQAAQSADEAPVDTLNLNLQANDATGRTASAGGSGDFAD